MRLRHVLAATLLVGALPGLAQDLNIVTGVSLKDEGGTVVLSIAGSKAPNFTTFSMADPPRFVIDLSEARFKGVPEDMPINDGTLLVVKNLSYGSEQTSIARIMLAFAVEVDPPDVQVQGSTLVVRVVKPGGAAAAVAAAPGGAEREAQAKAEAQKRAEAEAQARAEAEAKAAAEAEAKAKADAELKAQQDLPAPPPPVAEPAGDAGKIAAAAAAMEQTAEAQAAAEAEAKRQKEEALAAKKAELQRKREEAVAAKEEAKRQRLEAIAAARAAAEGKKREEAERKAEARRQKQEALAAKQAEQQRKKEEAAAAKAEAAAAKAEAKAEAKRAREESLAVTRPSHVRELGFKQLPGASRVFLRTSTPPRFTIQDVGENHIRVELENARATRRNDLRFLDTSFFPGAVAMVTPSRHGSTFVLDIKLKQKVPYQQKVEGDMLAIDFERPGGAPAASGPDAPAPADAASADAADESGAAGTEPEAPGAEPEAPIQR